MLNLQEIEAQLAKGDPKLKATYLKLKERLTKVSPNVTATSLADLTAPMTQEERDEHDREAVNDVIDILADEIGEEAVEQAKGLTCPNCEKTCASLAGLKAHQRKCKA